MCHSLTLYEASLLPLTALHCTEYEQEKEEEEDEERDKES
jgi:hypothetical protein